ncbi:MAG TPA: 6-phosphogluconolactonase [bacterium]|nr:6-phosphogluconolactonase [bacterium]
MTVPRSPAPSLSVVVRPDLERASAEVAEHLVSSVRSAVAARGECAIALAGGNTPRRLYELLAGEPYRDRIPWGRLRVFFGDERDVPPDDARSNYHMARVALLARVPVPAERVHRMPAERPDLDAAAEEYERTLRRYLPIASDRWPRLDWVLLGLGDNAHTASLFPGTPVVREARRAIVALYVPELRANRMTVTPPLLNHAAAVVFLAAGAGKADAVRRVLEGPWDPDAAPAQVVRPVDGTLLWLLDVAAAARLTQPVPGPR